MATSGGKPGCVVFVRRFMPDIAIRYGQPNRSCIPDLLGRLVRPQGKLLDCGFSGVLNRLADCLPHELVGACTRLGQSLPWFWRVRRKLSQGAAGLSLTRTAEAAQRSIYGLYTT